MEVLSATIRIGKKIKFSELNPGIFCLENKKWELFVKIASPFVYANAIRMNGAFVLVPEEEEVFPVTL